MRLAMAMLGTWGGMMRRRVGALGLMLLVGPAWAADDQVIRLASGTEVVSQRYPAEGKVLAVWGYYGTDVKSFNVPSGIAVDALGNVYVADSGNNRVLKFAPVE